MATTDKLYRWGETDPVNVPKKTGVAINGGDMLFYTSGNAGVDTAANFTWDTDTATSQAGFHASFMGVSGSRSLAAETADIRVCTFGTFEFACAAATFHPGQLVGPAKASGNALESQKVVAVDDENLAIGRVVKRYATNTTTVLVRIFSHVFQSTHSGGGDLNSTTIAAVATSLGFLSFLVMNIRPMRAFGVSCAAGIFLCWLLSMTILPGRPMVDMSNAIFTWRARPSSPTQTSTS